ncbi:cytochrome oxidase complex assembly protein 1-domain-containing protein [Cristinia sonorae]|uniref:Cytochrome oxidase complex assembly protein 1-domain-containing protein n=1 Tax=Cristinia sonorae TaxID=1940300 RepID=A0A8K0XUA2_9AGAR|nr:cytochrome oxidase complex assembly protein 1-domain-containing protein [Cristinia sonorae]
MSSTFLRSTSRRVSRQILHDTRHTKSYATFTEFPRPPPPSKLPETVTYSEASKPREYYARPKPRDLPPLQRRWPVILVLGVVGSAAWGAFYAYAQNQEKLSSSVFKQILNIARDDAELQEMLGDAIRPEPAWYLNGDPWISGANRMLQGNVDLSFRLKGHKGTGTLYFTSIRRAKGEPFTIIRFKVIGDNGQVVNIPPSTFK